MYAYIKGKLVYCSATSAIVEAGGIGYKIFTPVSLLNKLPLLGSEILLYVSFVVRELSHALYGFLSEEERDLFETLLSVSGIGPKTALSLIGHLSVQEFYQAIGLEDMTTIVKVPGIGKKTAERLVIELRDKLGNLIHASSTDPSFYQISDPKARVIGDAMSALISLGYNQNAAQKAIKKTMQDDPEVNSVADLITSALRNF
jgi:Holliday junction DNA helicase RuvA